VGTGRPLSILEVARALAAELGKSIAPQLLNTYRAGDIRHCYADPTRARAVLGFDARHRFEDGLPELVAWCRKQTPEDTVESGLTELKARGLLR